MKLLLSKALIVAAVGIPATAFSLHDHRQVVLSEDPFNEALVEEGFHLEENNKPETEWDLFSEDSADSFPAEEFEEADEDENVWWESNDYDSTDWNLPRPPPKLKDGFPWDGPQHPPPPPPPPRPADTCKSRLDCPIATPPLPPPLTRPERMTFYYLSGLTTTRYPHQNPCQLPL